MSTKDERQWRTVRRILPIRVKVRQKDGSYIDQIVDADVREDKRNRSKPAKRK